MIGVMSVQSTRPHAYGERECLIFRSICSYVAIALANAESYRRLAAMETLEALGAIGQEITASLVTEDVFDAVGHHVERLFGTGRFQIGLIERDAGRIRLWDFAPGEPSPITRLVGMDDSQSLAARVIRDGGEMLVEFTSLDEALDAAARQGIVTMTTLLRRLSVQGRVLGVMALKSDAVKAFSERHVLLFRSLCSYLAIGLANAEAYRQEQAARLAATKALENLRAAQRSLFEAEKLAALGRLVAGVAHEVNTPIGMALTVASTLGARTRDVHSAITAGAIRRTDLMSYFDMALEAGRQLDANLRRATFLMGRFKDVASDSTRGGRRAFALGDLVAGILSDLTLELELGAGRIEADIPDALRLDTYPGACDQVLRNLLLNAVIHADPHGREGRVRIGARAAGGRVEIVVSDEGVGLPEAGHQQMFEPFFAARGGRSGLGLGLHISYNLATKILLGQLTFASRPGEGTSFCLDIPTVLPGRSEEAG